METHNQLLKVGNWLVEPNLNRMSQQGRQVSLRPQVMDLLVYLAENRGQVVTAQQLIDEVWQGVIVGSGSVYNCINELRHAFDDDPRNPACLETISRRGYRLIAPVEFLSKSDDSSQNSGVQVSSDIAPEKATTRQNSRIPVLAILALLGVLIVASVVNLLRWQDTGTGSFDRDTIHSLAVLPLQDFSSNSEEFWSDGLTAALITELSKIQSLRVISHTSVMPYRQRTETLPAIAKRLRVDAILDGSITRDGEQLSIAVSLVRAKNERTVWSANYQKSLRDVLQLHRTIALEVASEIDAVVKIVENPGPTRANVVIPEAYEAMLRGEFYLGLGEHQRGLVQLRRAVEIDRDFALGWATLSEAYLAMAINLPTWITPARKAADRALALDPDLPQARTVLAGIAFYFDWDWERAEQELLETLRLNPGYDNAHQVYGDYLEFLGAWDQSIAEGIRATKVNPDSVAMLLNLGITYIFARRYPEAEQVCRKALDLTSQSGFAHRCIAEALAGQGDLASGLLSLENAVAVDPDDQPLMAQQAIFYMAAGQTGRARAVAERLNRIKAEGFYVSPLIRAMVFMALGEKDTALDFFEMAVEEKAPWTPGIHAWPYFDPLRGEPRFQQLIDRVGLRAIKSD